MLSLWICQIAVFSQLLGGLDAWSARPCVCTEGNLNRILYLKTIFNVECSTVLTVLGAATAQFPGP